MELSDVMRQMMQETMNSYGLSDMTIGTVTSVKPLTVKIREGMADIPKWIRKRKQSLLQVLL